MDAVRSELLSRIKQHSELMNNSALGAALERKKYRGNWRDANEETTNNRWQRKDRTGRRRFGWRWPAINSRVAARKGPILLVYENSDQTIDGRALKWTLG